MQKPPVGGVCFLLVCGGKETIVEPPGGGSSATYRIRIKSKMRLIYIILRLLSKINWKEIVINHMSLLFPCCIGRYCCLNPELIDSSSYSGNKFPFNHE